MNKVVLVFGTRPEAIKMAPVYEVLKKRGLFDVKVLVTAQHREMLDSVLNIFSIKPDYDLSLMKERQTLAYVTKEALVGIVEVLEKERPDVVLVHGDTTTTLAGSLAAYYLRIPLGHVEAGLRTGDIYNPFPEEFNRIVADVLSDLCFAPTRRAAQNLLREGISESKVFITGNTVVDALLKIASIRFEFSGELEIIDSWDGRIVLVTFHRRESWGEPLIGICSALNVIHDLFKDLLIIIPLHLNPEVRKVALSVLRGKRFLFVDPLPYIPFVHLMRKSYLILTDSGGIQEEAPSLGVPVLVIREKTERPEALEAGVVKLVGRDKDKIIEEVSLLLENEEAYGKMKRVTNPYGDGRASERIATILEAYFS
ncbi:MAG: UDP-N-acetylglucosamine 2-epimerase (non-hydrolyzing) [Synergistetes bacterium]|nr:UDP-N-acetylglucosamine 2-epimerase (non-hydrolyzing) [Synergistota bacterium]MCX8127932.1 UDP-N-acetylglucosamine 2-epimerase (non-hydrolyzing) [Synergistota bacterium]MDW8192027.1 UDP-N-acetylglucosamine 2-epimerase (non-hydrolyzing) [Synergistota bacterium]